MGTRGAAHAAADGTEARLDTVALASVAEGCAELHTVVGDGAVGSVAGAADGTIEDGTHLVGGLLVEDREPDDAAREVVEDDGNPPAEGPPLGERRGQPWHPEAGTGRHERQVDVPRVAWVLYDDRSVRRGNFARLS